MKPFSEFILRLCCLALAGPFSAAAQSTAPLTTLDYRVRGSQLTITPAALAVPKGIAGSVATNLSGAVPAGSYVEATLRGPSFAARRLVGAPNQPLLLPPLNLSGDYSLNGIRLADGTTNATLLDATPPTVPVQVFDELLVSRVTSQPLTAEEIQERGIVIDENNFRAIEFEVGFVLDGVTVPVRFPVVTPQFSQTTEIIPAAELEERLAAANRINDQLANSVQMPPALEVAHPNIDIRPVNIQFTAGFSEELGLSIPPIPALMVIPGNIGFLNQFFSVMIFTENAAPAASGLSVHSLTAELILPAGPDRVPGTFAQPGDDPIRFARVGPNAEIRSVIPVRAAGADGQPGTPDDVDRLQPGDGGQGEFLVEGLQEGLHVMELKLKAKLDGLAAGTVEVEGTAAGSVQVSNPKFSMAFSHPRTVRAGESYDAHVTLLNTSQTIANFVSIALNPLNISGGVLQSAERVEFPTLRPGETATATFRILSQRTGGISFSNITTSDDSLVGRFRLRAGVDERGVLLSRSTLLLPDFVNELPEAVVSAANRVLGQALSASTAPQLPPGVIRVPNSFVKTMAIQLAEAGQRVRYGEALTRVLADLLLDWQGSRDFSSGWDQIIRSTDAGRAWRDALMTAMEDAGPVTDHAVKRLTDRARDFAGTGQVWLLAAMSRGDFTGDGDGSGLSVTTDGGTADTLNSTLLKAAGYGGRQGAWLASRSPGAIRWTFGTALAGETQVSVLRTAADGTAQELLWRLNDPPAGACAAFDAAGAGTDLSVDDNCDGTPDRAVAAQVTDFTELPPQLLVVQQDPELHVARPQPTCYNITTKNDRDETVFIRNYANVVALLFSKPMTQESAANAAAYSFGGGIEAVFVQVQPGGRVALMTLRRPMGAHIPRSLSVGAGITDARGNDFAPVTIPVTTRLIEGIKARGRVIKSDGSGAAGVPVTLTYIDGVPGTDGCLPHIVRISQVFTASDGSFAFDFILTGIPFTLSATNTEGLSDEVIATILANSSRGELNSNDLLNLAGNDPSARNSLLEAFGAGSLPQAIAAAEGLDRAVVGDFAAQNRQGSEGVYALTFRGRATVTGTVLAADGTTPVSGAAVNLFPDPGSRELGRGLLTDSSGRFAFFGVPLGTVSVEATSPAGQMRTVSALIEDAGSVTDLSILLSATVPVLTTVQGRVTEPDGTPHGAATVYVRAGNTISAALTADDQGYYTATGVPAGNASVVAISADGRRAGERNGVDLAAGATNTVNIALQARATVSGRVEFANGDPVAGALVGGGEVLATTDELGRFTLTGVPTGPSRSISAGLAANENSPDLRRHIARTGSTNVAVQPGDNNFAVVRFNAAGRITGQVLDELGRPVPNSDIAIPLLDDEEVGSFMWVNTNAQGRFLFDNMGPGTYDLSSPAPPHDDFDVNRALSQLASGDLAQMETAINAAFGAFVGANDPFLNGEGANFNPGQWGFTKDVRLDFDGQTVDLLVRYLPRARISGVVKNGQGVPIGAKVRLTGVGPKPNGKPTTRVKADLDSDPALGTFLFNGQAFIGDFGLQAASPFFSVVVTDSGRTTQLNPVAENRLLQFPAVQETNGSLAGQVLNPDGSPAGGNVRVQISFGSDFFIRTDAEGRFATTPGTFTLPANGYTVTALDEVTGATGRAGAAVLAGQVNQVTVRLLGRGTARITVHKADGTPAAGAAVELQGGDFPGDRFDGTTGPDGVAVFNNVFEGPYAVCASLTAGGTRLAGRSGMVVAFNSTAQTTVTLGGTGTVRGTFVRTNGTTPVPFAAVTLGGGLAVAPTDADGRFELLDVPLGTHRITATDAATGRSGFSSFTLTVPNEVRELLIVETALGSVTGLVIDGSGTTPVPGVEVTLALDDRFVPNRVRIVTTGPDGAYSFAGVPAGTFRLTARHSLSGGTANLSGVIASSGGSVEINLLLTATANLTVQVFETDGTTPATNATVTMSGFAADTDAEGRVRFEDITVRPATSPFSLFAVSRTPGETRNFAFGRIALAVRGAEEAIILTMRGTGTVEGTVFLGDGTTPAPGAEVKVTILGASLADGTAILSPFSGQQTTVVADGLGRFSFDNLPAGRVQLTAASQSLGAQADVEFAAGQTVVRDLILTASGTVTGRIVRADGTTPAAGAEVGIRFTSATNATGNFFVSTGPDGRFSFAPVTVGTFTLSASLVSAGGVVTRSGSLTTNGESVDAGDLVLDEALPTVVSTVPAHTADGVDTTSNVEVLFSEAMRPESIDPTGIFLRRAAGGPPLPATVTLVAPAGETARRLAVIDPADALESETEWQIVVVDGDLTNAFGGITNRGPRDLEGRILPALFTATFTTRDQRPPLLLSFTPENNAVQVDTRAVVRLTFDEPIQSGATVTLSGPGGPVTGTTSLGLNNLALTFVPSADLAANASFTATVNGVKDIAGNDLAGQPLTNTFSTLDTLGPVLSELRLKNNAAPLAGSPVVLEAVLAAPELNPRVRFTAGFNVLGTTAEDVVEFPFTLPAQGRIVFGAIAIDRFGNEGPLRELTVDVLQNTPPVITFTRVNPVSGPVSSGSPFAVRVEVADDGQVTDFRAAATGAGTVPLQRNATGDPLFIQGVLPGTAVPGTKITIVASATDNSGRTSGEQRFDLDIADGTPPAIAFVSPAENAVVTPQFDLRVSSSDNGGAHDVEITLSGGLTGTQSRTVGAAPNTPVASTFTFDTGAAVRDGSPFTATARATDGGGRSVTGQRTFRLPDEIPPSLVSVNPEDGAANVSVAAAMLAQFSEALDPATVTPATVTLTTGGNGVPSLVTLINNGRDVRLTPEQPLTLNTGYIFAISAGVRGTDGNAIAPVTVSFTTTDFGITSPLAGTRVIEGQRVPFTAGPPNAGFAGVIYAAAGLDLAAGAAPSFAASVPIPSLTELGAVPHLFGGRAIPVNRDGTNLAIGAAATQSSTGFGGLPALANDGNRNGSFSSSSVTHTNNDLHAHWQLDLGEVRDLGAIDIYWRTDCCPERNRVAVLLADEPFVASDFTSAALPAAYANGAREVYRTTAAFDTTLTRISVTGLARFLRIVHLETNFLSLAEVEVYEPQPGVPLGPVALDVRPAGGDEDNDGLTNGAEIAAGLDPFRDDAGEDPDNDGRTNAQEVAAGTGINDPDSDDDGLNDGAEFTAGSNPLNPDTDSDGLRDGVEATLGTNPVLVDTDGDTLSDGVESGIGRLSTVAGSFTWLEAQADALTRGGHLLTITSALENSAVLAVLPTVGSTGFWIGLTDRFIENAFRWETGETSFFLNFAPGQPDNSNNEDFVHFFTADGRWNDHNATHRTGYVLETGFYTDPLVPDSDGDGIRDDEDTFPGQINRAPVTVADAASGSPDAPVLIPAGDLLNDDSDPDGDPFVLVSVGTPANGTATLESNGGQVRYVPNAGFFGPDSFTYTIMDAGGLTAEGTVNITIGSNHPPVAGTTQDGGFALEFDGTDDFLHIAAAAAPELDQFSAWTIEAWVRPGSFSHVGFPTIYSMGAWRASVGLKSTGRFDSWINNTGELTSIAAPVLGEWTHVALVHDGANRRFIVNGVESGVFASALPAGDGNPTRIGAAGPGVPDTRSFFRGSMDEIRVWSRARTAPEVESTRFRRLSGTENGLAAYWPLDEGSGMVAGDASGFGAAASFGNGTAAAAPAWIASTSPVAVPRQDFSVVIDTLTPLALSGSDIDGNPLTARIHSLPVNGRLFQAAAGGGPGTEITSVPVAVTSSQRVVFYEPPAGFTGIDAFNFTVHDGIDESSPAIAHVRVLPALAPVTNDLWDISAGTTVTDSSGFHPQSGGTNLFGGSFGVEPGNAIFADGRPAGFTHFVEWESGPVLFLEGASLFARDDGPGAGGQRGFSEMRLFGRLNGGDPFTLLATFHPGANPYFNPVRTMLNFSPFIGKQFRAEFDQFGTFAFAGPRLEELDAIGETVVMVPTPAEVTLQNATSDRSQGGFTPVQLIDGIVVGGQHGWAGDVGGTPPMTAVFETAANIGATVDTEFTFGMPQPFGSQHFIGCFRISATTDDRSEFADGLINGGDITANWTVLDVVEATSTGGETITILPDKSVLIGGAMPATTSYTVRAKGISGAVTGFRLELLEHPSLPNNGPGRVGHGNWVLAEFTADVEGAVLVPNRAPQPQPDSAQTPQGIPVTTGSVLANDSDPDGDAISLADFTQPAAGTGSVADNGNGTFTYTPPDGAFTGEASFTYRVTDGHQTSRPATVTITVLPSPERVWTNAAGGNWNTAANWLGGNIPGPDDIAVIDLNGTYTVTLDTNPTVSQLRLGGAAGTQTLNINGRTLTVTHGAAAGPGGLLLLNSGTVNFSAASAVQQIDCGGGSIGGAGSVTVTGAFNWSSGTLGTGGELILAPGAVANITGTRTKGLNRVLRNQGTVNYTGNALFYNLSATTTARIENEAGATFIASGEADLRRSSGGTNAFNNAGVFIKRGAGTTTFFESGIPFNNTGTVTIESGTFDLRGGGTMAGTIDAAGGPVTFTGGTYILGAGSLLNQAALTISNATLNVEDAAAAGFTSLSLTSSTVNFAVDFTLASLTLSNSNVGGAGSLTVTGTFDWSSGTLATGGELVIAPGGVANITSGTTKGLNRVLRNQGTVNYTGNALFYNLSATTTARIENEAGATFIASGEADFQRSSGGTNAFNNAGILIKRGAGTTTFFESGVPLNNSGTVTIESGTLDLRGGGSNAGTLDPSGGPLTVTAGTFTLAAGGLAEALTLTFTNSTLAVEAGAPAEFANLTLNNATVSGPGNVTVTGTLNWISGTFASGAELIIAPGGVANITSGTTKGLNRVLRNQGTVNYTGNALFYNLSATTNARIENEAGATFIASGEADFQRSSGGTNAFNNAGVFVKRGAGTTTFFESGIPLNNTGTVTIESGTLDLRGGGSNAGTLDPSGGPLTVTAGTFTLAAGGLAEALTLTFTNSTLAVEAGAPAEFANLTLNNATVSGPGNVTVTGTLNWISGTFASGAELIIAPGGIANLTGAGNKGLNRILRNQGTVNYTGNALFYNLSATTSARIENEAGATFIADGEADFRRSSSGTNAFNNAGAFIKRGAGTTTNFESGIPHNNTGTVTLEAGTLQLTGGFAQDGILAGTGTVVANVTNNGTVRPDSTPGGLTIQGTFAQTAGSRLELTLAANDLVLGHRSFRVTGAATLNGALDVALVSPFSEPQDALLAVLSFDSRAGDFTSVTGLTNNFGYTFSRAFTATTLDLTVTTVGSLPPTPNGLVLGFGFAHWMAAAAAQAGRDDLTGGDDDPDGDGAPNLLEYALGTRPFLASSMPKVSPLIVEENGENFAVLEFHQRLDTGTVRYIIEQSDGLNGWTPVAGTLEISRRPVPGQPLHSIQLAVWPPLGGNDSFFLRLKVEVR